MKKKSIEIFEGFLNSGIRYFKWVLVVAAAVILLTGVYKVDSSEVAVVLRFGAITGDTREDQIKQPGLHFSLPNFIDEVVKIPVERIQELSVGTLYGTGATVGNPVQNNGYAITGDSNIVRMDVVLKYKISDPVAYALRVNDLSATLNGIITGEMTAMITRTAVDDVLTTEKSALTSQTMKNAQAVIDTTGLGVTLTNIELTIITPPAEAIDAFNKATTASVQKQTLIQQAKRAKTGNVGLVDLPFRSAGHGPCNRFFFDLLKQQVSFFFAQLFGIVDPQVLQPLRQNDRRREDRPRQRAAPCLVDAADEGISLGLQFVFIFVGHWASSGVSKEMRPSLPARSSSNSMVAARRVSTSPPAISIPRFLPIACSSSHAGRSMESVTL